MLTFPLVRSYIVFDWFICAADSSNIGIGGLRHNTRHDNVPVLRRCGSVWSIFALAVCGEGTPPKSIVLRHCGTDVPESRGFL